MKSQVAKSKERERQLESEVERLRNYERKSLELERNLESVTKSKHHYKSEWVNTVKELAKTKKEMMEQARLFEERQRSVEVAERKIPHHERIPSKEDMELAYENKIFDQPITKLLMEREVLLRMYSENDPPVLELNKKITREFKNMTS